MSLDDSFPLIGEVTSVKRLDADATDLPEAPAARYSIVVALPYRDGMPMNENKKMYHVELHATGGGSYDPWQWVVRNKEYVFICRRVLVPDESGAPYCDIEYIADAVAPSVFDVSYGYELQDDAPPALHEVKLTVKEGVSGLGDEILPGSAIMKFVNTVYKDTDVLPGFTGGEA